MAVKSRRYGMAPAQIPVLLTQKPSTENGIHRATILFLAWTCVAWSTSTHSPPGRRPHAPRGPTSQTVIARCGISRSRKNALARITPGRYKRQYECSARRPRALSMEGWYCTDYATVCCIIIIISKIVLRRESSYLHRSLGLTLEYYTRS